MTDDPYLSNERLESQSRVGKNRLTFVFSWWALTAAGLFSLGVGMSAAVAERYYELWTYTSRSELARSLSGFPPPSGSVLNNSDVLRWFIAPTTFITLPYFLLILLVFVPLFLWLLRPKQDSAD